MEEEKLSTVIGYYALKAQKAVGLAPEENYVEKSLYKPFISEEFKKIAEDKRNNDANVDIEALHSKMAAQQYKDVESHISSLQENSLAKIVNTQSISFITKPSEEPTKFKHFWNSVNNIDEHKEAVANYYPLWGACEVQAPHPYAYENRPEIFQMERALLDDINDKNAIMAMGNVYSYVVQHEIGHCLSELNKQGSLEVELDNSFKKFFDEHAKVKEMIKEDAFPKDKKNGTEMDAIHKQIKTSEKEVFADVYACLQVQREYYLTHKTDIDAGKLEVISPLVLAIKDNRYSDKYFGALHDSHFELGELINVLKKPETMEKLGKASDEEIYVTTYQILNDTIDKRVSNFLYNNIVKRVGRDIDYDVNNYFQSSYKALGVEPLFKLNPEKINQSKLYLSEQNHRLYFPELDENDQSIK